MTFVRIGLVRMGLAAALAATLSLAAAAVDASGARAQEPVQVNAGIKATIGLGLVGAELGFVIPAAAGLDDTWAFIVFPIVGATGGALAGYFLVDQGAAPGEGEISVALMAAGMALALPAMVLTLALTAYDPEDEGEVSAEDADLAEEFDEGDEPAPAGDAAPAGAAPADPGPEASNARARRVARAGTGLLRVAGGQLLLGVPGLAVRPAAGLAGEARAELHVPLLSGTF